VVEASSLRRLFFEHGSSDAALYSFKRNAVFSYTKTQRLDSACETA
jgi:hypothetical protein